MTTKHTPGPWNVWPWENESVARLCVGPGEAGEAVCTFFDGDLEELSNADANARLIASAPELLEALKRCDPGPDWTIPENAADGAVFCEISVGDIKRIRSAIAKATGQEPT